MSRDQPQVLNIDCSCGAIWSGLDRAHCASGCHHTFQSIEDFDRHRAAGDCGDPRTLRMVATKNGIWGAPPAGAGPARSGPVRPAGRRASRRGRVGRACA